ncbi:MAG: hypothetical protein AB1898_22685 [Acidobacteriota bacterium]
MAGISHRNGRRIRAALYVLNTFPKAFLIWGLLDETPRTPLELELRLKRRFPYLTRFHFLSRKHFNQYCHKSLRGIVRRGSIQSPSSLFDMTVPTWRLTNTAIKGLAGFVLARCARLDLDSEELLGGRRAVNDLTPWISTRILQSLREHSPQETGQLAAQLGLDRTVVDRHVQKWQKTGLVTYRVKRASSTGKRRVKLGQIRLGAKGRRAYEDLLQPAVFFLTSGQLNSAMRRTGEPSARELVRLMTRYERR